MKRMLHIQRCFACVAAVGMLLPTSVQAADQIPGVAAMMPPDSAKLSADVALQPGGALHGAVVNSQGTGVADAPVVASQRGVEVGRTTTDASGAFQIGGLQGGLYQISAAGQVRLVRAWNEGSAPPVAKNGVMLVASPEVTRGQRPLGEFFTSDAFILTAIVAAAIAIPVAVHNSKDNDDDNGSGS